MSGVVIQRGVRYAVGNNTEGQAQITRDRQVIATDKNKNGVFEHDEFLPAATTADRGLAGLVASTVDTGTGAVDPQVTFDQSTRNRAAGVRDINDVIAWPQDHDRVEDLVLRHLAGRAVSRDRVNSGYLIRPGFDYRAANDAAEAAAAPYIAAGDDAGMWRAYVESYVSSFRLANDSLPFGLNDVPAERWDTVVDAVLSDLGY